MATIKSSTRTRTKKVGKAGSLTLAPRPSQIQPKLGAVRLLRQFAPSRPFAPAVPPEPQITDPNPVPALMLAARRLKEAGANEEKCRCQTLGVAFEGAARADVDPEARGFIKQAWQEAEGKMPRMDDFNSLLRHTVALTLMPQNPAAALKSASFYTRAMIEFPRTMKAAEVAETLRVEGLKNRAHETAQRRAAQKSSAMPAMITSSGSATEDPPRSPEPHVGNPPVADVISADDGTALANQPDWVDIAMKAQPQTAHRLETMSVNSPVAAAITRDAAGTLRVEVAP
jgi:hypothetical protein